MSIEAMSQRVEALWENPTGMLADWDNSDMKSHHESVAASWVIDEGYGVIADLGCGNGRMVSALSVGYDEYAGFDQSMAMIAEAQDKHHGYEFALVDIFNFSPSQQYDVVLMLDVAQHQNRPLDAILRAASLWDADKYVMSLIVGDKVETLLMSQVVPLSGLLNVLEKVQLERMYMERYGTDHQFAWTLLEFRKPYAS